VTSLKKALELKGSITYLFY